MVKDPKQKAALLAAAGGRRLDLSDRNACDVELLAVGCDYIRPDLARTP